MNYEVTIARLPYMGPLSEKYRLRHCNSCGGPLIEINTTANGLSAALSAIGGAGEAANGLCVCSPSLRHAAAFALVR
jgi:hypothetical protein